MDKLKLILDFFKKYLFWFVFAGTIILVLVCWWMSTALLAKSFQLEQVKIKKKFDEVKTIADDQQRHPTQKYIDAVNDKHKELKEGVLKVWETLYKAQKENNPWPREVLGESAAAKIDKMGANDTIPTELRERYQNGIKKYFPILYKIIDLRHPSEGAEGGGGGNAAPAPRQFMGYRIPIIGGRQTGASDSADWVGTVDWDATDQQRLEDRFKWERVPDSDVIRLGQEDLWVYKTLLQVISGTNNEGDPQRPIIVPNVKRIEWIQIGADAIGSWSAAEQSVFKAPTEAAVQASTPSGARSAPTRDAAAAQDSKEQLLKDRYVDDKGLPLAADAKSPYSEFKMMPISMKLYMDQRKISKLLVECANSPMPIEVRRVSIRRVASELLDSGTTAAASPAGPSREYNRRTVDVRGPARPTGAGGGGEEGGAGSYDIPVEIQGIIYIYSPPDLNTLGTGTAGEKPAEIPPGAAPAAEAGAPAQHP
ncbi:MAG: hypothetical protein ABSE63_09300 [Thermoguttaceae bacterium]